MRIYINDCTEPYFNLAAEEYLLDNTSGDIFMLWRNSPAVIIGKNQNAYAEVNLDYTAAHGIKVVRRLTGGGAVFHDPGNVNFTFISPRGGELDASSGEGLDFLRFTEPMIEALSRLGVEAKLSGRNDILAHFPDGERKVSGNAQCVRSCADGQEKTLHHGTLLYCAELSRMSGALNVDPTKLKSKGIKSVRSRVGNLVELLTERYDVTEFMDYLAGFAASRFGAEPLRFTPEQLRGIERLAAEKYSADEWNLRRMGSFETEVTKRFDFGRVSIGINVKSGVIADLRFEGDFFGERDAAELAERLIGARYERGEVFTRLGEDVCEYISGADAECLCKMFFTLGT